MNQEDQNRFLAVVIVMLLVFFAGVGLYQYAHKQRYTVEHAKLISEAPLDKTPYKSVYPAYEGLGTLTDRGMTDDQLTGLKYELYTFGKSLGDVSKVIVDTNSVGTVEHIVDENGVSNTVRFNLSFDGADYRAKLFYTGFSPVELFIYDSTGTQLFDSEIVDINS